MDDWCVGRGMAANTHFLTTDQVYIPFDAAEEDGNGGLYLKNAGNLQALISGQAAEMVRAHMAEVEATA